MLHAMLAVHSLSSVICPFVDTANTLSLDNNAVVRKHVSGNSPSIKTMAGVSALFIFRQSWSLSGPGNLPTIRVGKLPLFTGGPNLFSLWAQWECCLSVYASSGYCFSSYNIWTWQWFLSLFYFRRDCYKQSIHNWNINIITDNQCLDNQHNRHTHCPDKSLHEKLVRTQIRTPIEVLLEVLRCIPSKHEIWTNVVLMLANHLKCRPNINPTLFQCCVIDGLSTLINQSWHCERYRIVNPLSAGDAFKRIHTVFPQLKFDRNWTNMHV